MGLHPFVRARSLAGLVLALALAACGSKSSGDGDATGAIYDRIELEPPTSTVSVPLGGSATQSYQVFGVVGNNRTEITSGCGLSLDITFGTATAATVTVRPHGGKTLVTALCGTQTGTAQLAVELTGTIVTGTAPGNAADLFGAATLGADPARTPAIEYPIDQAIAPVNIPPIEAQWTAAGNDLFHLALTGSYATIDVYTTDLQATLSAPDWAALVQTVAGSNLAIKIEALAQADATTRYAGAPVSLVLSHDTVNMTAIYYWASSQGNIMTQTFGSSDPPALVKNDCTSCHSLSREGTRLGYSRCVGNDCNQLYAGFLKYDAQTQKWGEAVDANAKAIHGSYTTFAPVGNPFPTDATSAAIVTMINGTLSLYDPDTGAAMPSNLDDVSTHGPGAPRSGLMADWSASGEQVVFASTPHPGQWIDLSDSRIATMSYAYTNGQHVFGEPQFLVPDPITLPGGTYTNFFFPSYSGDGKLIVFNAARGAWRNFSNAASAGQRLMLAAADGAWVTDLTALNGGTVDNDITWPHWAPGETTDYYWIVFSSERDYGHEITAGHTDPSCVANGVRQCKQIWIGAIAKSKLASGGTIDPSAPPVWLPGQDPKADNISPYWTVPVPVN
ncbi:MAG: hypothetical protein K8W52_19585 [Deltaproteobacteria bacterium]|nr:hypothetical protein [Deltaproteobacteria bacterium]